MGPETKAVNTRQRKDAETKAHDVRTSPSILTSLHLATTQDLQQNAHDTRETGKDSTYGVQSFGDDILDGPPRTSDERHTLTAEDELGVGIEEKTDSMVSPQSKNTEENQDKQEGQQNTAHSSPFRLPFELNAPSVAHSLASLSLDSQAPLSSFPSSPKSASQRSLRPSDEDSLDGAASQAVASSGEDETEPAPTLEDSAPQLIMPSIKMPSRRPFTEVGKALGRLKIMIAGDSGVGKTSLIRSIVQKCEDIVHVDPLASGAPTTNNLADRRSSQRGSTSSSTQYVSEVYASTRPYPPWWSDAESTTVLRQRKSLGGTVLERNICFVDTPGYSSGLTRIEVMDRTLQYTGEQVKRSLSNLPGEGDIVGLLSGNGGSQVDLVLYLISLELKQEDVLYLKRLGMLTNVIVLMSKSDARSSEETELIRRSIRERLQASNISQFQFPADAARQPPFTVCSLPSDDNENMDASLLMSSDYVQPLIPSELEILLPQIFEEETASCLRHLAATKLMQTQRHFFTTSHLPPHSHAHSGPLSATSASPKTQTSEPMTNPASPGLSPFVQAKMADHTQHEERLAQIRLAKWAADLQRSLQNERQRYEALAQGERVAWLSQKLDEVSREKVSFGVGTAKRPGGQYRVRSSGMMYRHDSFNANDPLGLLRWNEIINQKGWVVLQVAGGFGVLGAVVVWMAKSWSLGDGEWSYGWWRGA